MKKLFATTAAVMIAFGSSAAGAACVKPVMIYMGADWCAPCRKMTPFVDRLRKEYAAKSVDIRMQEIWDDPTIPKKFRAEAVPTQIFYDRSGAIVERNTGFMSEAELRKRLDALAGLPPCNR